MAFRLFERVLWQKTTHYRKSDFRIDEESDSRIVLRTRNYGLLFGGAFFFYMGFGVAWLGVSKAADETPVLIAALVFAGLCALFGVAAAWASRTQRDTIVIDRDRGIVRSERAKKRKKPGDEIFTIHERPLTDLTGIELDVGEGSAWLRLHFKSNHLLDVDHATDIEHLKMLGRRLAAVAGVELRER